MNFRRWFEAEAGDSFLNLWGGVSNAVRQYGFDLRQQQQQRAAEEEAGQRQQGQAQGCEPEAIQQNPALIAACPPYAGKDYRSPQDRAVPITIGMSVSINPQVARLLDRELVRKHQMRPFFARLGSGMVRQMAGQNMVVVSFQTTNGIIQFPVPVGLLKTSQNTQGQQRPTP